MRFSGSSLPAMEERKAAKALPFACHFSLTGTVRFFCCFFARRLAYHPLSLHQSLNIWMNFLQCVGAIVSCILISELQEAYYLVWISLLHHVGKEEILRKQKRTPRLFNTPNADQSRTKWGHNKLSVPKNELRAGHKLRKTLLYKLSSRANIQAFC